MENNFSVCREFLNYIETTMNSYGVPEFASLKIYCPQEILCPVPNINELRNKKIIIYANHLGGTVQNKFEITINNITDFTNPIVKANNYDTRFNLKPPFQFAYTIENLFIATHLSGLLVANLLIKINFYETSLIVIPANEIGLINENNLVSPLNENSIGNS